MDSWNGKSAPELPQVPGNASYEPRKHLLVKRFLNHPVAKGVLVFVHLGCYSKIPNTGWPINNQCLFIIVLETRKSKIKAPAESASGGGPLPGSQIAICSLCPHMAGGVKERSGIFFIRALIPFLGAPPSWPNYCPNAPPPHTITVGIRFQHMVL